MFKKIKFYKHLLIEIIETLCTICLFLESYGRRSHIPSSEHFYSHFKELKMFSEQLRKEDYDNYKRQR